MTLSVTASEARSRLFPLIEQVNADQVAVEIVSRRGTAFLVSADEYPLPPRNRVPPSVTGECPPPAGVS